MPLQWAATQTNLGTALKTLGGRKAGTARLTASPLARLSAARMSSVMRVACESVARLAGLWANGAPVSVTASALKSLADLDRFPRHLAEIHAAPQWLWAAVVARMVEEGAQEPLTAARTPGGPEVPPQP